MIPGATPDVTSSIFVPRFLEGQSAVSIQQVSCGDLFTACLTGEATNTRFDTTNTVLLSFMRRVCWISNYSHAIG